MKMLQNSFARYGLGILLLLLICSCTSGSSTPNGDTDLDLDSPVPAADRDDIEQHETPSDSDTEQEIPPADRDESPLPADLDPDPDAFGDLDETTKPDGDTEDIDIVESGDNELWPGDVDLEYEFEAEQEPESYVDGDAAEPGDCPLARRAFCGQQERIEPGSELESVITDYTCSEIAYPAAEQLFWFYSPADCDVRVRVSGLQSDLDLFRLSGCGGEFCEADSSNFGWQEESLSFHSEKGRYHYLSVDGLDSQLTPFDWSVFCQCDFSVDGDTELDEEWEIEWDSVESMEDADRPPTDGDLDQVETDAIDSDELDSDTFELDVELNNIFAAPCNEAIRHHNDTYGQSVFTRYNCSSERQRAKEVIYHFTPSQNCRVTATVTGLLADLNLFLLDELSPLSCRQKSTNSGLTSESLNFDARAGESYYLVVDAPGENQSSYLFRLSCACDADGDQDTDDDSATGNCSDPHQIICGEPFFHNNQQNGISVWDSYSCPSKAGFTGYEAIYHLELDRNCLITARLDDMQENLDLFLLDDCDPNTCLQRATHSGTSAETISLTAAAGETMYFVVEGYNGNVSDYTFQVDCGCVDPDGDITGNGSCESPYGLACDDSHVYNNAQGSAVWDTYSCSTLPVSGREIIYRYSALQSCAQTARLTNLTGDLDLFLLSDCSPDSCLDKSANIGGESESISFNVTQGESVYLVVDGFGGATSNYTMWLDCTDCGTLKRLP